MSLKVKKKRLGYLKNEVNRKAVSNFFLLRRNPLSKVKIRGDKTENAPYRNLKLTKKLA
jgi:hypothetical protein